MGPSLATIQQTGRMLRNAGVQPMAGHVSGWNIYRSKMYKVYPDAFRLGSLKKKGRQRMYVVWVNGGDPVSFPTKAERREFILSTQVLLEANDE